MKVYDLEGKEHEMQSVDARECVAIGWTYEPKAEPVEAAKAGRGRQPKGEE